MREIRRDFEADIAIPFRRRLVHGPHGVGGVPHILDRQLLVQRFRILVSARPERFQRRSVICASSNGVFEDGRVARDAAQSVVGDQLFQLAAVEEVPADRIEPDRLAQGVERS
jgi:hypothetical protein